MPNDPDPTGKRIVAVREALRAFPHIEALFWECVLRNVPNFDYASPSLGLACSFSSHSVPRFSLLPFLWCLLLLWYLFYGAFSSQLSFAVPEAKRGRAGAGV